MSYVSHPVRVRAKHGGLTAGAVKGSMKHDGHDAALGQSGYLYYYGKGS